MSKIKPGPKLKRYMKKAFAEPDWWGSSQGINITVIEYKYHLGLVELVVDYNVVTFACRLRANDTEIEGLMEETKDFILAIRGGAAARAQELEELL